MKTKKISQETLNNIRASHEAGVTKVKLAEEFSLPMPTVLLALEPGFEHMVLQGATSAGIGKPVTLTPELRVGGVRFRVPLNLARNQKDALIDFFDNFDGSFDKDLLFEPKKRAPRKGATQQEVNTLAQQIGEALTEESTSPVDALAAEAAMLAPAPDAPTQQTAQAPARAGRGRKRAVLA